MLAPLRILPDSPVAVRFAALSYLAHILCEGWINTSQGFLGIAVAFVAVAWFRGELSVHAHRLFVPMAIFVVATWISAIGSRAPLSSIFEAHEFFNFLTFVVAITLYRNVPALFRIALHTFAWLAVFLSTYGLVQYFALGQRDLEHRITATAAHVMTYSGLLTALALFFLVLALDQKKRLWVAAASLSSIALVLTFTRGAWIGWLTGAAAFVVLRRPRWVPIAVPALLLLLIISPLSIFGRFISSFDVSHPSNLDRLRMLEAGVEIIRDQPLAGVGPSQVKENYPLYRAADAPRFKVPHLHNNLVQLWAERGFLAPLAYLMLVATFIHLCFVARRRGHATYADAGIAVAVGLAVAGLFEFNFGDSEVLLTMLDLWAISAVALERPAEPAFAG